MVARVDTRNSEGITRKIELTHRNSKRIKMAYMGRPVQGRSREYGKTLEGRGAHSASQGGEDEDSDTGNRKDP